MNLKNFIHFWLWVCVAKNNFQKASQKGKKKIRKI